MGKIITVIFCFLTVLANAQNVGIGTVNPVARLHVTDSSVLFSATGETPAIQGLPPIQGAGRRMMWYPDKAAFRAGYVGATEWDKNNIGTYSMATGYGTMANQGYATAFGFVTTASGVASTSMGNQTTAKAFNSLSIGAFNDITDNPDPFTANPTDRIFQIGIGVPFARTNALTVLRNGNIGIGVLNPGSRLHIANGNSGYAGGYVLGMTLETNTDTYLNLLAPNNKETGLLFGKASDLSSGGIIYNNAAHPNGMEFRTNGNATRMVLADNGYLGIGVPDPAYRLDVSHRMRVRSGGDNSGSAGIWLNNNANIETAFIGMEDDDHIGFYGNGAGWKFAMNTQTGALKINGSEGIAGQVLKSNGSSTPSWGSATNSLYNNTIQLFATAEVAITSDGVWTPITGMTYTFNPTGNARVLVLANVNVHPGYCFNCATTSAVIGVFVDGVEAKRWMDDVANDNRINFSASYLAQVGPGNHTIELRAAKYGPATYFASGGFYSSNMILQIIPE